MYCPNCGTQTSTDQKFCRGCGMSLGQSSQTPLRQAPGPNDADAYAPPANVPMDRVDQRHRYMRLGFILFWGGIMLAALLGILGDAMQSLSWRLGHFIGNLAGLGGLVLLTGLGVMIYSRFFPPAGALESSLPRALPYSAGTINHPGQQTSYESREPRPGGSVTEHTTYTLDQQRPGSAPRRS